MERSFAQERPTGITVLALLYWAAGILALIGVVLSVLSWLFLSAALWGVDASLGAAGVIATLVGGLLAAGIATLYCVEGRGLWLLRPWARIVAIVLQVLALAPLVLLLLLQIGLLLLGGSLGLIQAEGFLMSLSWISGFLLVIAIPALILWYLCTPEIATAFREVETSREVEFLDGVAPTCSQCGSDAVVPIIYGVPIGNMWEDSKAGRIAIGGCPPRSERWSCNTCGRQFDDRVGNDVQDWACPNVQCGRALKAAWRYCPYCDGFSQSRSEGVTDGGTRCENPACGRTLQPRWRFCPYCRGGVEQKRAARTRTH